MELIQTLKSSIGSITIDAKGSNNIWNDVEYDYSFDASDEDGLVELLLYAILEGPRVSKGDYFTLCFIEFDGDYCWTWADQVADEENIIETVVFTVK